LASVSRDETTGDLPSIATVGTAGDLTAMDGKTLIIDECKPFSTALQIGLLEKKLRRCDLSLASKEITGRRVALDAKILVYERYIVG
jgi:hypothetical protein